MIRSRPERASSPSIARVSAGIRNDYLRDGFLLRRGLFQTSDLTAIKDDTLRALELQRLGAAGSDRLVTALRELFDADHQRYEGFLRLVQNLLSLGQIAQDQRILSTLRALGLEFPTFCLRPLMFLHSPHLAQQEFHHRTPPHQDWRSMQGSIDAMVVWMPLVDVDEPLGPLQIVPGSHRRGLLGSVEDPWYRRLADVDDDAFVSVPMRAGDVLFFSAFLVHRSGENRSGDVRWSVQFRYNNAAEPTFVERKFANPYSVRPQQELITPDFPTHEEIAAVFGTG